MMRLHLKVKHPPPHALLAAVLSEPSHFPPYPPCQCFGDGAGRPERERKREVVFRIYRESVHCLILKEKDREEEPC